MKKNSHILSILRSAVLLIAVVVCADINAQGTDNYKVDLPSMPYLSPEAASLGKYGEIPVSESTMVA